MATTTIDMNAATAELDAIPELQGHGFEIVRDREDRGGFSEVRQLQEAPGLAGKWDGAKARLRIDEELREAGARGGSNLSGVRSS